MEWTQVLTILGGNIGLFLWSTRQARTDFLHLDRKLEENRKETNQIVKSIQEDVKAIQEEMKEFHARMEKQDAEFKGKMALQDAEFKAHMMYYHTEKNKIKGKNE